MRILTALLLLTVVTMLAGASALEAQQRNKAKRYYYNSPKTYFYNPPGLYSAPRVESECQRRANAEDPTGQYAGYPCWAREIFGRGQGGGLGD